MIEAVALLIALGTDPEPITEPAPSAYVLVMWESSGTYPDLWPQEIVTSLPQSEPDLFALDESLPTCGVIQIDLYWDNATTRDLIAGGILTGPNTPPESLAYVVDGDPWRVIDLGECVPVVDPPVTPPVPPVPSVTPAVLADTGMESHVPEVVIGAGIVMLLGVVALITGASRKGGK